MNIAFIPVRGGSKSIPLKNIKDFCGKPLVYWTVSALQKAAEVDKIVVATDSRQIKQTVIDFGFSKVEVYDRKPENAIDTASTESVMLEYINIASLPDDTVFMLVQATSPVCVITVSIGMMTVHPRIMIIKNVLAVKISMEHTWKMVLFI